MQTKRFDQPFLNLGKCFQAQPCAPSRAGTYRSAALTPASASRANAEHAFASVSRVLGLETSEDISKSQQPRNVTAHASPAVSSAFHENASVGEVDYDVGLRNNIQIAGNLGRDVDYRVLATNRLANFTVAIRNKNRDADWVDVEAWGALAEAASQQLGKGTQVAVKGRLKQDKWTDGNGQARTRLKVVAHEINKVRSMNTSRAAAGSYDGQFVEATSSTSAFDQTFQDQAYPQMDQEYTPSAPSQYSYSQSNSYGQGSYASNATEDKWKLFFQDRSRYWDNRLNKRNPKAPDFKHKESGDGLWLSSAPQWAKDELDTPELGGPVF